MKIFAKEQLSPHKYKTPEGYLICTDAILARTGKQMYKKRDFFPDAVDGDEDYEVDRLEADVFEDKAIASFENKPITVEHPDENVNSSNWKEYEVGFVRDVHRGEVNGQPVLLGNLVIRDEQTIKEIEAGEHTDLSCGYDCDVNDEENPHQTNIRGNHVALCREGRAGIARIQDSKVKDTSKVFLEKLTPSDTNGSHDELADIKLMPHGWVTKAQWETFLKSAKWPYWLTWEMLVNEASIKDSIKDEFEGESEIIYDACNDSPANVDEVDVKNYVVGKNGVWFTKAKNESSLLSKAFCSYDGGKTWHTCNLERKSDNHDGRTQAGKYFFRTSSSFDGPRTAIGRNVLTWYTNNGQHNIDVNQQIDHVNGNYTDDRLSNLERVSGAENLRRMQAMRLRGQADTKDVKDVEPHEGEDKQSFISRFMGATKGEYPDRKQRLAVAYSYWDKHHDSCKDSIKTRDTARTITTQCYIISNNKILTQERPGPSWPGIAVPGGHVKADETPLEAVVREVREETGLEVRQLRLFGVHQYDCEEDGPSIAMLYTTNDFYGDLREDSDEGLNRWSDINEVLKSAKCADGFQQLLSKLIQNAPVTDSLTKDADTKANLLKTLNSLKGGWHLVKEGQTISARKHFEFETSEKIGYVRTYMELVDMLVDRFDEAFHCYSTYNGGQMSDGRLHVVIDVDDKHAHDSCKDSYMNLTKAYKEDAQKAGFRIEEYYDGGIRIWGSREKLEHFKKQYDNDALISYVEIKDSKNIVKTAKDAKKLAKIIKISKLSKK